MGAGNDEGKDEEPAGVGNDHDEWHGTISMAE
jgi:hypothetical protein